MGIRIEEIVNGMRREKASELRGKWGSVLKSVISFLGCFLNFVFLHLTETKIDLDEVTCFGTWLTVLSNAMQGVFSPGKIRVDDTERNRLLVVKFNGHTLSVLNGLVTVQRSLGRR